MVYHGAFDEVTTRRIRPAFDSILLRPRMLRNVANRELSTTVLGQKISLPVMAAAAGQHQYAHPDDELATARAAAAVGTALGARACLIGKPLFYALAVDGENGVRRIFEILKNEPGFAMAMCGVRTIDDIDPSLVTRPELAAF